MGWCSSNACDSYLWGAQYEYQLSWRRVFCDFPQFLQVNAGRVPQLGHNCFLPNSFQIIINLPSIHSTLQCLATECIVKKPTNVQNRWRHTIEHRWSQCKGQFVLLLILSFIQDYLWHKTVYSSCVKCLQSEGDHWPALRDKVKNAQGFTSMPQVHLWHGARAQEQLLAIRI
jgi:hypothetical protein